MGQELTIQLTTNVVMDVFVKNISGSLLEEHFQDVFLNKSTNLCQNVKCF